MEPYIEHQGKAVETDNRFKHVMAITLDPRTRYREGIVRCIMSREGSLEARGYVDRSELHKTRGNSLERFEIGERLKMKNEVEIIKQLGGENRDFIGFEDPDIWGDEQTGLSHVYFTVPFRSNAPKETIIHLGHAVGKNLDSLEMTTPVLMEKEGTHRGAKEVSIAPLNRKGFRYNLFESSEREKDFTYSVVRVAIAKDMGKPWEFSEIVFHPKEQKIPWIGGHASPGPLFSKNFIDVGEGKALGLMNGREADQRVNGGVKYGIFSIGFFIYDYENGKIEWVSPKPFIQDSEAKTITFASQFVPTGAGSGILYAHVDDSFIRAYMLNAESIKSLLP